MLGHDRPGREGGFTLVELLVVVIILAILAALGISLWLGQREKAHRASAIATLRNVETMVVAFNTEFGAYPDHTELAVESTAYTFVAGNQRSTGETVVSVAYVDDSDPEDGLVMAAAGGATCYYLRFGSDPGVRFEHKAAIQGSTDCSADEFISITPGSGW